MLAFLAFNFYFILPYYTFQVHATQDLITLIVFLIVAVVMSQLIGQAREGMRIARIHEWEATRMYELISSLAGLQDIHHIVQKLASHAFTTFKCYAVEVTVKANPQISALRIALPQDTTPAVIPTTRVSMTTARGAEGELKLWINKDELTIEEKRLLEAFTGQGALAIERVRLTVSENKTHLLEESDRIKTSLLNSVSHELRSPLAAIKASISSLRSGAVDWDLHARQDLLETVEEETDHLNLLVGNLLDMSRIESDSLQPLLRWNSIEEIFMGVAAKMRKQLLGHPLEVVIREPLPLVPTDYVMMEQVFTNLLSNSIKYAPANTPITVSGMKEGNFIHIILTNQGPLIPEEFLDRIFEKFNRVTDADRITGTGLGLSICKGLVEAHQGKIWAENQACCLAFHVLLPCTLNGNLPVPPKEAADG